MQDKYSLAKCEHYGRRLAARLSQQFFETQPAATLDGPALLAFTPIRQVNLLVLRQLMSRWQQQARALRSPYFDFEAAPVQAALGQFLNVLSRHLALGRAALEPLLAQAAADTLLLAADPAVAFARLLPPRAENTAGAGESAAEEPVALAYLREQLRYLDQARPFFEEFFQGLPGGGASLDREFLRQRFDLHLAAHRKLLPTVPQLVAALSALLPLTEADLWGDGPAKPGPLAAFPAPPLPVVAPAAALQPGSAPTQPAAGPATAPRPATPLPTAPLLPTAPAPAPPAPEQPRPPQPAAPQPAEIPREAAAPAAPLVERAAPPVGSLREAISINQRFSFINELFGGENMEYHAFIQQLDQQPDAAAAGALMRAELAARPDWARKEEHVAKLLKLLERKYSVA